MKKKQKELLVMIGDTREKFELYEGSLDTVFKKLDDLIEDRNVNVKKYNWMIFESWIKYIVNFFRLQSKKFKIIRKSDQFINAKITSPLEKHIDINQNNEYFGYMCNESKEIKKIKEQQNLLKTNIADSVHKRKSYIKELRIFRSDLKIFKRCQKISNRCIDILSLSEKISSNEKCSTFSCFIETNNQPVMKDNVKIKSK